MVPKLELALEQLVPAVDVTAAGHRAGQVQRQVGPHRPLQLVILRVLQEGVGSGQVTAQAIGQVGVI